MTAANSEATGDDGEKNFQGDKNDRGADGGESGEALFVRGLFERFGHFGAGQAMLLD
jgi:hypothetical protein